MKLKELLTKYCNDKTPLFINGMGVGKIAKIEEDYIEFETIKEGKEKRLLRETTYIGINDSLMLTEGEKEIPKTATEEKLDKDLEDL